MDRRAWLGAFALAVLMGPVAPPLAQAQPPERTAETIQGLPGVMLKLIPPAGLCRLDAVDDADAFKAMAGRVSGQMLAVWLSCPDLARYRAGENVEPARWMMVIAERDGQGAVRPLPGITRQEAFTRWGQAWKAQAAQRVADAEKKLRAEQLDIDIGKPQIVGPDDMAIYLVIPGAFRDAGAAQPIPVASVSGWSMFFDYRIGVSLSERRAGPERFEPLRAEVRDTLVSLDRLSVRAPAP